MWKRLFATIGYANAESASPQTCSDYETESRQFRIQLRKADFLNLHESNHRFKSLDRYSKLSEEMKSFSITARAQRIDYIKKKLNSIKPSMTRSISITIDEA